MAESMLVVDCSVTATRSDVVGGSVIVVCSLVLRRTDIVDCSVVLECSVADGWAAIVGWTVMVA